MEYILLSPYDFSIGNYFKVYEKGFTYAMLPKEAFERISIKIAERKFYAPGITQTEIINLIFGGDEND